MVQQGSCQICLLIFLWDFRVGRLVTGTAVGGPVGIAVLLVAEALLVHAVADAHEDDEDHDGHYDKHSDAQLKWERLREYGNISPHISSFTIFGSSSGLSVVSVTAGSSRISWPCDPSSSFCILNVTGTLSIQFDITLHYV